MTGFGFVQGLSNQGLFNQQQIYSALIFDILKSQNETFNGWNQILIPIVGIAVELELRA